MTITPDQLRSAAFAERAEIESRVRSKQRTVATYFDLLFCSLLRRLEKSEAIHKWDVSTLQASGAEGEKALLELQWLATYLERRQQGRFVSYEVRQRGDQAHGRSEIRSPERAMSQVTSACLTWKGRTLFKSAFDFAILPMLIWELKPGTVFEVGSGTGTSARWIADTLHGFGLETEVYSTDINPVPESHPGIHFLRGDCSSPATLFAADLLRSAPRPFLVLEDAHVNTHDVFAYIDRFLEKGDYLFVEDSHKKSHDLDRFLSERPDRYAVDTYYTDFFGRNSSSAINSILVKL